MIDNKKKNIRLAVSYFYVPLQSDLNFLSTFPLIPKRKSDQPFKLPGIGQVQL